MSNVERKPLGRRVYGSIGHLPNSRLGPGDHKITDGQAIICTAKARDRHDLIIVQEKLDGSCCAVARSDGDLVLALGRAGYEAETSKFEQHRLFASWVRENEGRFRCLPRGFRVVGEWLAQAHGIRYKLEHEPFVPFDFMHAEHRMPYRETANLVGRMGLCMPALLHIGGPADLCRAAESQHGAIGESMEGVVYRVERNGEVDFLAKWVRESKVDGCLLPEVSGKPAVWNWPPEMSWYDR